MRLPVALYQPNRHSPFHASVQMLRIGQLSIVG